MSIDEVKKYFKDDKARIAYTNDAEYKTYYYGRFYWWLCSPGNDAYSAAYVFSNGSYRGVRPALNLKY